VQQRLVLRLDTFLAGIVGAAVGTREPLALQPLQILLVDSPEITDHVRRRFALRILAKEPRLHLDAGKGELPGHEARHLLVREMLADRDAAQAALVPHLTQEALAVALFDRDDFGEAIDRAIEIPNLRRIDLQGIGSHVARECLTVNVQDLAAMRYDGHERLTVVFGQRLKARVLPHLQLVQTAKQGGKPARIKTTSTARRRRVRPTTASPSNPLSVMPVSGQRRRSVRAHRPPLRP